MENNKLILKKSLEITLTPIFYLFGVMIAFQKSCICKKIRIKAFFFKNSHYLLFSEKFNIFVGKVFYQEESI